MEIAGPSPVLLCNLASAQARVGQPAEAIESVRWALRLDSGMVQAHLILGALLANDRARGLRRSCIWNARRTSTNRRGGF